MSGKTDGFTVDKNGYSHPYKWAGVWHWPMSSLDVGGSLMIDPKLTKKAQALCHKSKRSKQYKTKTMPCGGLHVTRIR